MLPPEATAAPVLPRPGVLCLPMAFRTVSEDLNEHVNNVEYVRMMQEVAIAHVAALGWPPEAMRADGVTWVVRSHRIDYHRPCFAGEPLLLFTWVRDFHRFHSHRAYRFVRAADRAVLADAESDWVFFDFQRGRPAVIPEPFTVKCPPVPDDVLPGLVANLELKNE